MVTGTAHGSKAAKAEPADERTAGGTSRRRQLVQYMHARRGPVLGSDLARHFRVSRQCLVQDIAILRAAGEEILSTPQGYRVPEIKSTAAHRAILACQHPPERTEEELHILVDHGVKVLDVIVEHPLYGELRGALMVESRSDVADFMERWRATRAPLLSSLTQGVHLHTVEANKTEAIVRARAELHARGFLLK